MSEDLPDLEPIDVTAEMPTGAPTWPPGWYADPWTAGQYRYWSGQTWTGQTNRWGPAAPSAAAGPGTSYATDPWASMAPPTSTSAAAAGATASGYGRPTEDAPAPEAGSRRSGRGPIVIGIVVLVVAVLISGGIGYAINSHSRSQSAIRVTPDPFAPGGSTAGPTTPSTAPAFVDPDSHALQDLVVRQADVGPTRTVLLIPDGNSLSQPTLDLCFGTYPSERQRRARLQVVDVSAANGASATLSTEAVLYRNPAASVQAFAELRKVVASCPHGPVTSPIGEGTESTVFKAPPDATWPHTPTVERQAYSMVTTQSGTSSASIAVYLRRGRALLGVYFPQPSGSQPPVAGQRTIAGIVGVFAARMAKLPTSVVNRR